MWIETSEDDEGSGGRIDATVRTHTKRSCARTAVVALCSFTPFASSISAFLLCFSPASSRSLAYSGLLSTSLCALEFIFFGVVSNSGHSILWSKEEAEEEEE
jgi:hypothetical protein